MCYQIFRMTREICLIAKPDERNYLEREKDDVLVGGQPKMNWVGEVNERYSDSDESRHRLSGTERAVKWCRKRTPKQRGMRGEHLRVCYLHLRHRASTTSKWEEQSRPQQARQPLMFSHHTNGHPNSCGVPFCGRSKSSLAARRVLSVLRIGIFQNALGWQINVT